MMANPQPLASRAAVLRELPDILLGPARTANSAIHHNLTYVGLLTPWVGFENDVIQTFNNTPWGNAIIAWGPETETYMVGDEHGLQGRLVHHIGHVLGRVAQAEQLNFMFRDSKSCLIGFNIIPDFLMSSSTPPFFILHAVGELKVFWISAHRLGRKVQKALNGRDEELRKILGKSDMVQYPQGLTVVNRALGQTANYMQVLQVRYAILTTYKETIFVRQSAGHVHKLEFSPPIQHDATFNAQRGTVTLRQCYLHLASLGRGGSQFQQASVRSSSWVSSG